MTAYLFVGEKPSGLAYAKGWTWKDGRLSAATLLRAVSANGIHDFDVINLFGDHPDNPELPVPGVLRRLKRETRRGRQIVALGQKVRRQLKQAGIDHYVVPHPAARGLVRAVEAYNEAFRRGLGL